MFKIKKNSKIKEQKIQAKFKTTDGEFHISKKYGWYNVSNLVCKAGEYAMIDINHKNYIEDNFGTIFPLNNIIYIEWNIIDERESEEVYL